MRRGPPQRVTQQGKGANLIHCHPAKAPQEVLPSSCGQSEARAKTRPPPAPACSGQSRTCDDSAPITHHLPRPSAISIPSSIVDVTSLFAFSINSSAFVCSKHSTEHIIVAAQLSRFKVHFPRTSVLPPPLAKTHLVPLVRAPTPSPPRNHGRNRQSLKSRRR